MKEQNEKASNPVFRNKELSKSSATPVTKTGVVMKTLIMLAMVTLVAVISGSMMSQKMTSGELGNIWILFIVAIVATLAVAIMIAIKPKLAKPLSFVYAIAEGFLLGTISVASTKIDGGAVVPTALFITLAVVVATNILYTTGIIKVNQKFVSVVYMMTFGAFIFYMFLLVGSLLGMDTSFMFDGSPLAILISVVMLFIASLNLFTDYYEVDTFIENGADSQYEWYLAFGLTVTIVWVYIEALRLVRNLTGNN
ncbi:Bax inhibitor-1/YccA family protein [Rossellomorea marisflavi]|uniref:Bax inhibitor-1/YccA family protein n=1 Tax=Rossellomorea marisflavi TaxID=189381 RepID=UPI003F9F9F9D